MASTTQDKLYETFVAVSGQQDSNLGGALDSGEEIAASLSDTVKRLGDRGELPFYRVCKRGDRRFRLEDVMMFLDRSR